ncbi:S-layer homology domain-containing protein [Sinanaerobacter chloroacetimidivorans]|uniref:S-layer homology domain-containing protein n=1 Tax=Sinanaerobacter chloroacetimidivorans TaxID=2818044 RepID=A0A8J7W4Q4_9FIRM|nr:S-layer homology domain-containing protein [Sinanaerobacter chloroacetimidivorans]MBR0599011.1 S-layer homology domain-containing protein [Sinanaerobacter chloroacetimidivorans]
MNKRMICIALIMVLTLGCVPSNAAESAFSDVPKDSWAESYIQQAVDLGIISGFGDGIFGFGQSVTRAQFAAMLVRLFGWEKVTPENPAFTDNSDKSQWYYSEIETAVVHGAVVKDTAVFRPNENITREEMAVMLVRALGYNTLAGDVSSQNLPFADVQKNQGYITMAYDFGIINGLPGNIFQPDGSATREQAAAMMIRLHEKYGARLEWLHAFYAVSSYSQSSYIPELSALSFGWSKLQYTESGGPLLNTTSADSNEYSIPSGYEEVVTLAQNNSVPANLNIYMSTVQTVKLSDGTTSNACREILLNPKMRTEVISQIIAELTDKINYAGVTIDFEEMKGNELKAGLSEFLKELRAEMNKLGKKVYVCVPPATADGYYFDAYDYKTIGQYADKVILMAHDYQATSLTSALMSAGFTTTPVTPVYDVFYALEAITDSKTGVEDRSKIALAMSFNSVQWAMKNGSVTNAGAYRPVPSSIYERLIIEGTTMNYAAKYQNPYITFKNETQGTDNIVWYEDERSVAAKVELARMFGINSISLWRLGLIPNYDDPAGRAINYDVMEYLAEEMN